METQAESAAVKLVPVARKLKSSSLNSPTRDVLADCFGLPKDSVSNVAKARMELLRMLSDAREELHSDSRTNVALYLEPYNNLIENVLDYNSGAIWANYQGQWSETVVLKMEAAAHFISNFKEERAINDEGLKSLQIEVKI